MTSASLRQPDFWWYRARSGLLRTALGRYVPDGLVIDVGSADGPSVDWLDAIPLDVDFASLQKGVCADARHLPFADRTLDGVCAFDVVEHFEDDRGVVGEFCRVLRPGGMLLVAVPAYQWAWSEFDVRAGHHRRYTRRAVVGLLSEAGLFVERATYAFATTLPLFVVARMSGGGRVAEIPLWQDRILMALAKIDRPLLRRINLPFGSSLLVAARLPQEP